MVVARQAAVRPHVVSPLTGDFLPLEDELCDLMDRDRRGIVRIVGDPGSGKTTALEHLAYVFSRAGVQFLDGPPFVADVVNAAGDGWIVFTAPESNNAFPVGVAFALAPWGDGEWLEYLLARHKDQCAAVLARLKAAPDCDLLGGNAELWSTVLDEMGREANGASMSDLLVCAVEARCAQESHRQLVRHWGLELTLGNPNKLAETYQAAATAELATLLRHRAVHVALAAVQITEDLNSHAACTYFDKWLPHDLVLQVAKVVSAHPKTLHWLDGWLHGPPERHAMAASILHAAYSNWKPPMNCMPRLAGAYFSEAAWAAIALPGVNLRGADLSGADLRQANLNHVHADRADLGRANLRGASLEKFLASGANLADADLSQCTATQAHFDGANLERADLEGADMRGATFAAASLAGACFREADLREACLIQAKLQDADFTDANLEGAILAGLKLSDAIFSGACFAGARLVKCDLEEMDLPAADFREANLKNALLTGSTMPDAQFDGACLVGAGLAEIGWERASLRNADLRGVSFHLGSSRSGLVGSPIACEGSRTGFYTDDFTEQDFKSPEEIRKANLCHADLRGAQIDGVDFYLVDLRHARLDPEQERHVRSCGAILEDRGC